MPEEGVVIERNDQLAPFLLLINFLLFELVRKILLADLLPVPEVVVAVRPGVVQSDAQVVHFVPEQVVPVKVAVREGSQELAEGSRGLDGLDDRPAAKAAAPVLSFVFPPGRQRRRIPVVNGIRFKEKDELEAESMDGVSSKFQYRKDSGDDPSQFRYSFQRCWNDQWKTCPPS